METGRPFFSLSFDGAAGYTLHETSDAGRNLETAGGAGESLDQCGGRGGGARTVVAEETGNAATQADEDEQRQPRVRDAEPGCGRPYRK